jgi:EpsI family protein
MEQESPVTPTARVVVSIVLLVTALVFVHFRSRGEAVPLRQPLDALPNVIGGWQSRESAVFETDVMEVLRPTAYVMRRYVDADARNLWLFVGFWQSQRKGAQPHSPKNCLPGTGWEPLEASRLTVPMPAGTTLTLNRMLIQKEQQRQLVLYWYEAQGTTVAAEMAAKFQMVKSAIVRNRTDGAIVRVSGPVEGGVAATSGRLLQFVQAVRPVLSSYLPD